MGLRDPRERNTRRTPQENFMTSSTLAKVRCRNVLCFGKLTHILDNLLKIHSSAAIIIFQYNKHHYVSFFPISLHSFPIKAHNDFTFANLFFIVLTSHYLSGLLSIHAPTWIPRPSFNNTILCIPYGSSYVVAPTTWISLLIEVSHFDTFSN